MAIKYSWRFCGLLLLLHIIAGVAVLATTLPWAVRLAVYLLIILNLIYYLMRDVFLLLPDSWCEILFDQGEVELVTRNGSRYGLRHGSKLPVQLANGITVSAWFVVLNLKLPGHRLPVSRIIFPDALDPGVFREFCVRLKFMG